MRRLVAFFIHRNRFVDALTVLFIIGGVAAALSINLETFPSIQTQFITVDTIYPGASAQKVEEFVTNPLEQDLKEVDGVKEITSSTTESRSSISVEIDVSQVTTEEAERDIQNVVDRFRDLPEQAEDPIVTSINFDLIPVMTVAVMAAPGADVDPLELRRQALKIEKTLERLDGIARVDSIGLEDREVHVLADKAKLERNWLTLEDLIRSLSSQNISTPAGSVPSAEDSGSEFQVRTGVTLESPEDVANVVIRANELGRGVRISDVARVESRLQEPTILTTTTGRTSITLTILKRTGANSLDLSDSVKTTISSIESSLPKGITLKVVDDFAEYVRRRLSALLNNFLVGLTFVLFILPLVIEIRYAVLVALGAPFAFGGALIAFYFYGLDINLLSMIGLIIMAGLVFDDAIVVNENIARLEKEGYEPEVAAEIGTMQIARPVAASVMTTVAAFLPLAFISGIFGQFTRAIPIAVISILAVSLFETYFILPSHAAHWFRRKKKKEPSKLLGKVSAVPERTRRFWEEKIVPYYVRSLRQAICHWMITTSAFIGLIGLAVFLVMTQMKFVLFPPVGVEEFYVRTQAPVGTTLEKHLALLSDIEKEIANFPPTLLESFQTTVGLQQESGLDANALRGSEYAQIRLVLTPVQTREVTAQEMMADLKSRVPKREDLDISFELGQQGPPTGKAINVSIIGEDYDDLRDASEKLKRIVSEIPGTREVQDSFDQGKEEFLIEIDQSEAAAAGVSASAVGRTVRAAFEGVIATSIRELDDEVDVRVRLDESDRDRISTLRDLRVSNTRGDLVPISAISSISRTQDIATYEHLNNRRRIRVTADVDVETTSSTEANAQVRERLAEIREIHPSLTFSFGGEERDTQESLRSLANAATFAVVSIFLILVLAFNRFGQPFLILFIIPSGVISVIFAFYLHGLPLSFLALLGIVALLGVAANDAIVFLDFVNERRKEGQEKLESILDAAKLRARPIFMTTVTTVAGVMPTAYGLAGSDPFIKPIALALSWGVLIGSFITFYVFPTSIHVLDVAIERWHRKHPSGISQTPRQKQPQHAGRKQKFEEVEV